MRIQMMLVAAALGLGLSACAQQREPIAEAAPPPLPPMPQGAVAGSMAADRDGDGIIDGYYSADGMYHPNAMPMPMAPEPPPMMASRSGERG
jgi:hypothetical protein